MANEEAYEREFNQEGKGRKRQTFPLSTGEFAKDQEAMPLTKREKKFRAEEEEMPEVKERSMKLPASEVRRNQTKRAREKERRREKLRRKRLKGLKRKGRRKLRRRKVRRRKRREEEKKRKKRRKGKKRGPRAVAVPLRQARVIVRSPLTHPKGEWAVHLRMMTKKEVR